MGSVVSCDEKDFIKYLNTWIFPEQPSVFIENIGQEWNCILTRENILKNNDNFDFILTVLGYALSVALIAGGIYSFKKS